MVAFHQIPEGGDGGGRDAGVNQAARGIGGLNDMLRVHAERSALKRNNTVDEVGDAALFLCSPLSRGITGEVIYCDAGYRIMGM